jgi:hypothetical protein
MTGDQFLVAWVAIAVLSAAAVLAGAVLLEKIDECTHHS